VPRVLVIGSANIDYVVALDRLPVPGETVSGGKLLVNHGGKGANQAVAARRLGAEVRFVGCLGNDASGAEIRAGLEAEGIGLDGLVAVNDAATGTALIVVDAQGRNQIAVAPGANRHLTPSAVERRAGDIAWADVLLCQLETPVETVTRALEIARAHRTLTVLNPAPVHELAARVWPLVDYLTPNDGEAIRLGQADAASPVAEPPTPGIGAVAESVVRAGHALLARGAGTVVVTLGPGGALACGREGDSHVAAFTVAVRDTTAAGDAFNGALAVALAEGAPLPHALRFACAAAALACTAFGARPSLPSRARVETLLAGGR
jgi:ribokinase